MICAHRLLVKQIKHTYPNNAGLGVFTVNSKQTKLPSPELSGTGSMGIFSALEHPSLFDLFCLIIVA